MASIPTRVADRIAAGIKRFQPILAAAKSRDVNESDTVVIIMDLLQEVFGYDKYSEITSEHSIRSTFCDLAIKLDSTVQVLVEVKAVGIELKAQQVKQSIDYAANQGVDWVVLTNGLRWQVYRVTFAKPIDQELVYELDFCGLNPRSADHIELLYLLTREGWRKSAIDEFASQRQALGRHCVAAVLLSEQVLSLVRRNLRKMFPDVRVTEDQIRLVITQEVIKREILEGDKAERARKKVSRMCGRKEKVSALDAEPLPTVKANFEPPIAAAQPDTAGK